MLRAESFLACAKSGLLRVDVRWVLQPVSSASWSVREHQRPRWRRFDAPSNFLQRHRDVLPAAAILLVTVIAYHFTLASLFDLARLQTPLAYVPAVPLFCLGMVVITARRYAGLAKPTIDRQLNIIFGVPLILIALLLITVAPVVASAYYWTDRADVLSMALFLAGATILIYGTTWFWRLKSAFLFLLLTWPALYLHVLAGLMQSFTDWTNSVMALIIRNLPLGATLGANPGDVVINQNGADALVVNLGTACSGADTVLGFALIGGAIVTLTSGGKVRKLSWWITGLVLTFGLNIVRLTSIIALAHSGHPDIAVGGYHAVIGLVLFTVTLMVMAFVLPLFGLRLKGPVPSDDGDELEAGLATSEAAIDPYAALRPNARPAAPRPRRARRRRFALSGVLLITAVVALADHGLQPYAAFDDGSGSPTVQSFNATASLPDGWSVQEMAQYSWVTQYFGPNSVWRRYSIGAPSASPVFADIVLTDDQSTFDSYNLLNCFLFHNYSISSYKRIDLGGGVYGLLMNYAEPRTNTKWSTISWAWPVSYKSTSYYERITLTASPLQQDSSAAPSFQPRSGLEDVFLGLLNGVSGAGEDKALTAFYRSVNTTLEQTAQTMVDRAITRRV